VRIWSHDTVSKWHDVVISQDSVSGIPFAVPHLGGPQHDDVRAGGRRWVARHIPNGIASDSERGLHILTTDDDATLR
jgi:hypothetical protein